MTAPPLFVPPPGFTYPFNRTPMFDTLKFLAASGKETRVGLRPFPRYQWSLTFDFLRSAAQYAGDTAWTELQYLLGWYNQQLGPQNFWQWADPDDNLATAQAFGTGDGSTRAFGLVRTLGGAIDPVYMPISDVRLKFFDNGSDVTAHVTLGTAGLATWDVAPAAGHTLTWTGGYNWLVRFDDDKQEFSKSYSTIYSASKFNFSSELVTWI